MNHHHCLKNRNDYETISDDDFMELNCEGDEACDERRKSTAKSAQGWRNVRAVMAYYYTLRKIKRHDFHNCHSNINFLKVFICFKLFFFIFLLCQFFGSIPFIPLHLDNPIICVCVFVPYLKRISLNDVIMPGYAFDLWHLLLLCFSFYFSF